MGENRYEAGHSDPSILDEQVPVHLTRSFHDAQTWVDFQEEGWFLHRWHESMEEEVHEPHGGEQKGAEPRARRRAEPNYRQFEHLSASNRLLISHLLWVQLWFLACGCVLPWASRVAPPRVLGRSTWCSRCCLTWWVQSKKTLLKRIYEIFFGTTLMMQNELIPASGKRRLEKPKEWPRRRRLGRLGRMTTVTKKWWSQAWASEDALSVYTQSFKIPFFQTLVKDFYGKLIYAR